jgi:hypothetical protein
MKDKKMSRSSSQTAQASFHVAPVGLAARLRVFVAGLASFEPAATAVYAENARLRSTGRNWLL